MAPGRAKTLCDERFPDGAVVTASLPREREIDGLRSLAIVPVLLYHTGWSWMPGGFVGVDAPLLLRLPSLHALAAP